MEATNRKLEEEFCGLVLTYRVNDTLLCVPVEHVDSVIEPPAVTEIPNAPDYVIGAFLHRGKTALALSLRKLLKLPAGGNNQHKKESLLVIWMDGQPIGYWVDEVKGMTDSGRGHWSAVPALIRDQGITRALVCDGQVYFPLDLTQSSQFKELNRTLDLIEQNRLQQVVKEKVAEENIKAKTPVEEVAAPANDQLLEEGISRLLDTEETEQSLLSEPAPDSPAEAQTAKTSDEAGVAEESLSVADDDYVVSDYSADNNLEQGYEEQIAASAFAEYEIDTTDLAKAVYEAMHAPAELISPQPLPETQFDANGQGDAFFDALVEAGAGSDRIQPVDEFREESANESGVAPGQLDAFDESYLEMLSQESLATEPAGAVIGEPGEDIVPAESGRVSDEITLNEIMADGLSLTEEPYSFLPGRLPEDDEIAQALPDETVDELPDDPVTETPLTEQGFTDQTDYALLRQAEIDAAFSDIDEGIAPDAAGDIDVLQPGDEPVAGDTVTDALALTEEPYSFLPARLPEDDIETPPLPGEAAQQPAGRVIEEPGFDDSRYAQQRQAEIEAVPALPDEVEEWHVDGPVTDELTQHELLPEAAPDQFIPADQPLEETGQSGVGEQPQALLPYIQPEPVDTAADDKTPADGDASGHDESGSDATPVIALSYDGITPPPLADMQSIIDRADYYADRVAESFKETATDRHESPGRADAGLEEESKTAEVYEFKIPEVPPQPEEEPEPPTLGNRHVMPQLLPGGIIIRPDGQINKSFGLVKLFTIMLATSAAGAWWFRDELFHKEHIRKEIPSILQNEIAFLYSDRVRITSPGKGPERLVVDTPEEEIRVIRRNHVTSSLLRERKKKGVKIHRVKKGDTLWAIAERYLDDAHRYPELAENNRIHNPNLIRPGDVVKITSKKPHSEKP